jgi:hypothetical protein
MLTFVAGDDVQPCWNLVLRGTKSCFAASRRIIEALEPTSSPPEQADLFLVPFYDRCSQDTVKYRKLADDYLQVCIVQQLLQ